MLNLGDMTFGIEIECYLPAAELSQRGWMVGSYHRGEAIPGFAGWNLQRDGSLVTRRAGYVAVEVVSGILRGREGLEQVKVMCRTLEAMRVKVNGRCGLHVHVGFPSTDAMALKRLVHFTANHERAIYASTGTLSRENGSFCAPVKSHMRALETRVLSHFNEFRDYARSRYQLLNLQNLVTGTRPAVEFRAFAGTTSFTKIAGYVQLCLGLVQKAINVKTLVKFDAAPLTTKSAVRRKGEGLTELNRLFAVLGWTKAFNCKPYGILDGESLKASMNELRRLAKKYDIALAPAPITPPQAEVEIPAY